LGIKWRGSIAAVVAGLVLTAPLLVAAAPASAAVPGVDSIRINEVESDGGTPGDWIELTNIGSASVDVSGWVLKDNKDSDNFAIPASTTIAAGGFAAFDVDGDGGFGLGAGDSARLYASDGTTLVDSYVWTAHADTTYGRCPDGTGAFTTTALSTKGAANSCGAPIATTLKINEVESDGGTPGDWIELTNTGSAAVDASGYVLKDNKDSDHFAIPANTMIAAGGYAAFDVDGDGGFGLGSGDSARLYAPDGTTLLDSYVWTDHASTTYGRCPDGTGAFATTLSSTKGAANDCDTASLPTVKINEVESNGGTPGDWIELINTGSAAVDLSGWVVKDSDDSHAAVLAQGTSIAAGGFYVVEEAVLGFGLGTPDSARVFEADGATLVDSYSWTPHATTTYGRCPDGTGDFATTAMSTKGAPNDCSSAPVDGPVKINEVESDGGTPGDWIELTNTSGAAVDVSGYVLKDSDDAHSFVIAAGTSIPAGGYVAEVVDVDGGFGLGGADSARLFAADGTTLLDSYSWSAHAATTYGRCPNGTGAFGVTTASTKGAANTCPVEIAASPWPGGAAVATADPADVLGGNMSGLFYEASGTTAPGTLWAVKNGPGTLFRLTSTDGVNWAPDTADGWTAGKVLHYSNGTGDTDSEGVTITDAGPAGGVFVSTERNNADSGVSRPEILRIDPSAAGASLNATSLNATSLNATMEWNLTSDLPSVGANLGLEGITWIPDSFLVSKGFADEHTGAAYDPSSYADHGTGLFFTGLEANGTIYAYALNQTDGSFTRVATIESGFPSVMELQFDKETQQLWAVCDDTCNGRTATLDIAQTGADAGHFVVADVYERPAGQVANINNEGFALAPQELCVDGVKPVFWSDDTNDDGHALRAGTIDCTVVAPGGDGGNGGNGNGDGGNGAGNGGAGNGDAGKGGGTSQNGGAAADPAASAAAQHGNLANTGAEPIVPAVFAAMFLAFGAAVVLVGRKRRAARR
jgi:hypothetical protein